MNVLEVYTKKEYECKKCKAKIYYGKIADDNGALYTNDGQQPNGKFGKDSNVISGAVDVNNKEKLHSCSEKYVLKAIEEAEANKGKSVKLDNYKSNLSEEESILWTDIVSKVCDYDILADKIIGEYPCDQSGQSKGRIKNIAAQVLLDIHKAKRDNTDD